ncbi:MAG: acetyl-CoA carboxylase carboxyltransferase subunit alpha/beta, partial [Chloroflexota bacterium]|nr:acetyl-CoA carboxylase carboxyltransferase subunit alpha/beta [Chloroflexota bacterium]
MSLADLLASFRSRGAFEEKGQAPATEEVCFFCASDLTRSDLYRRFRICPACRFHYSLPARERIELLADPGSFKEVNYSLVSLDPLSFSGMEPYQKRISEAQQRTGLTEALVTGVCSIAKHPTVLAVLDFGFLGGSMGCVVGEKMALAFELAIKKKLPLVTIATSGGTRMQEGILSLMQMAKTAAAAKRMDAAGLPFISVLANPTTGEVYASFANLGDIVISEPRALLGLAPLRVVQEMAGQPLPEGAHTAEGHLKHGMVDMIIERSKLRESLALILGLITSHPRRGGRKRKKETFPALARGEASAWKRVELARHRQRPTALDYIYRITSSFVELHGDRLYGD